MTKGTSSRRPLRIGYFAKRYPRLSETFILQEILEHERQGSRIHIFALKRPDEGRVHADLAYVKAPVTYLRSFSWKRIGKIFRSNWARYRKNPTGYRKAFGIALKGGEDGPIKHFFLASEVADSVEKAKLEHLHAHFATRSTYMVMLVSLLTGVPYSVTAHARDIFGDHIDRNLLRRKVHNASFVVTVSRATQDFLRSIVDEADRFRVRMIHNGVHPGIMREPAPAMPQSGLPLVLGVGRLVPKKGFHVLLAAAAKLAQEGFRFRLGILGEGPERKRLQAKAQELGLRVRFLGAQPHHRTLRAMKRCRVLALPCVVAGDSDRDVLPTVLLEAQGLARPIVTTPVGGIEDILIDGEGGFLVPDEDADALADGIRATLESVDRAREMGLTGRAKMEAEFDIRQSVGTLRALFARAAGREFESVSGRSLVTPDASDSPVSLHSSPSPASTQVVNS